MKRPPPRLIILTALIALTAAALNAAAFTSIDELGKWLSAQPANTADKPYTITLNVPDLTGVRDTLNTNKTKYVNLDLSGSTFTSIEGHAFYDDVNYNLSRTLTGIIIPNSVTSIGDSAFQACTSLTSVTISNSVTSIGVKVFHSCFSLTEINVAALNKAYTSQNGVLYNKDKTVLHTYPAGKTDLSFNIPNSVTSIGDYAFVYCENIANITIPTSVKSIGKHAFDSCNKLTGITIPASVTSIGEQAFRQCASLTSVIIPNSVTIIGEGTFRSCNRLISITIPNSVISIGKSAFAGCSSFTSVMIPTSVTSIMAWTFSYCDNLTSITIPASVTSIGEWAFFGCASLTSVTFTGTIESRNFGVWHDKYGESYSSFDGDLYEKFYATNKTNGTPGTYTTTAPVGKDSKWTKKL